MKNIFDYYFGVRRNMKKERNELKIIFCIGAIFLLIITAFLPLGLSDFFLPPQGGGMVHCDPQMSDNIRLPVPTTNVGELWYRNDLGGELFGSLGNGIAGNGRIAATTFNNISGGDNLIIYDYYGNHIWSDNQLLNLFAASSTPMIDIHDRVIACDDYNITLINASDHNNVRVEWNSSIPHYGTLIFPLPLSPTIVENKTIILPTKNGPLLAYDVDTGEKIAEKKLGQNITIDPYWGIPDMNTTNYITLLANYYGFPSVCPYRYNSTTHHVEWNSSVPYGIMPFNNHIFLDGNIAYCASDNNVTAIWISNETKLASNNIESGGIFTGEGYFSTINSACVKGNRVFLATEYKKPGIWHFNNTIGRLYAIDVYPNATNESERLVEAWNYTYFGSTQASPTLIGNTIYFDGYNNTLLPEKRDPHIYAIYTNNGTEKWKISYPNITTFSFAKDPRGGFWYEDSDQIRSWFSNNTGGNKLVRFRENNGSIIEEIDMKTILNDNGPFQNKPVLPCSCMTTCGTDTNPIMLISANHHPLTPGKWVLAINLSNNNSVIWKIPVPAGWLPFFNYAGGQYTILNESNQYRVLFGTYVGGVMAVGTPPDCWFENTTTWLKDSPLDNNNDKDSIQINYTIHTSTIKDHVMVKAILRANPQIIHPLYPLKYRYINESKVYNITSEGITDSINISLNQSSPVGFYTLKVYLYNSSGITNREVYENNHPLLGEFDLGYFANDSRINRTLYLTPLNDLPTTPTITAGPTGDLLVHTKYNFTASTTDPNSDPIIYQWNWRSNKILPDYNWSYPHPSGVNDNEQHQWSFKGNYEVRVRARDIYCPTYSDWSAPYNMQDLAANFEIFTSPKTLANHVAGFQEVNYGAIEPANFTWNLNGEGAGDAMTQPQYGCYVIYTYASAEPAYQTLTVRDALGNVYTANHTTQVLYVISNFTANRTSAHPNSPIHFTNTSLACSGHSITNITWDFGDQTHAYTTSPTHSYENTGVYNVTLTVKHSTSETDTSWHHVYIDTTLPVIRDLTYSPYFLVSGTNITLYADIYENDSGVNQVSVNITTPQNTTGNYTMTFSNETIYSYSYSFNDTWTPGIYNFTVWATDKAGNRNHTDMFWFVVSDSSPDNNTIGVSINPTLTVHVDDPNEEWANVSFYQYYPNSQGIDSENDWKAGSFTNTRSDGSGHLILANESTLYGTGANGDYTVTSTITLTGNKSYRNLTINSGKTLNTAGYILKVSGKLLNYGTITDSSTGGSGGSGGAGGGGQDFKQNSGGPKYAQAGSTGTDGSSGSKPASGHGGRGGAGGGGGGGSWHNLSGNDADGGNGGTGGTGGKGGGFVSIFAFKLDNQGVIHANGSVGGNGANGIAGGHKDFTYLLGSHDISGGGGGGAGGGNGGSGGTVNITYGVLLNQGKIYASAGAKGNKGNGGSGQYNTYGVSIGAFGNGATGGSGGGAGAGGAGGKGRYTQGTSDSGTNGNDGNTGSTAGNVIKKCDRYTTSGNYYRIIDAGSTVEWARSVITQTTPVGTSVTVTYGSNATGSWNYYENITLLPSCRWLKIRVNLSTNNITATPSVDKISISTRSLLHTDTNVPDGTNATYQWTGRSLNTWYYWQVRIFNSVGSAYGPVWSFKTVTS
jgi:hypothetical protein